MRRPRNSGYVAEFHPHAIERGACGANYKFFAGTEEWRQILLLRHFRRVSASLEIALPPWLRRLSHVRRLNAGFRLIGTRRHGVSALFQLAQPLFFLFLLFCQVPLALFKLIVGLCQVATLPAAKLSNFRGDGGDADRLASILRSLGIGIKRISGLSENISLRCSAAHVVICRTRARSGRPWSPEHQSLSRGRGRTPTAPPVRSKARWGDLRTPDNARRVDR
jgi:hypothetical protein